MFAFADVGSLSEPDLMRRFVDATVRGMKDAFVDPTAAGAMKQKIVPGGRDHCQE
jgi:hypothetical protein